MEDRSMKKHGRRGHHSSPSTLPPSMHAPQHKESGTAHPTEKEKSKTFKEETKGSTEEESKEEKQERRAQPKKEEHHTTTQRRSHSSKECVEDRREKAWKKRSPLLSFHTLPLHRPRTLPNTRRVRTQHILQRRRRALQNPKRKEEQHRRERER